MTRVQKGKGNELKENGKKTANSAFAGGKTGKNKSISKLFICVKKDDYKVRACREQRNDIRNIFYS